VTTRQGTEAEVQADTLCLHGDQPGAAQFAKKIRADLEAKGVTIATV